MRLVYELAADDRQVRRVMRSLEQEARAQNRRQARDAQSGSFAQARRASVSTAARSEDTAARQAENYWKRAHLRAADFRIRQDERAHRERLKQVSAEERAQLRAQAQLDRQRSVALFRQHREGERAAALQHASRQRTALTIAGGATRSVMGGLGTVARYGGMAAGLVGGFAAADALSEQVAIRRQAALLANQAGDPSLKSKIAAESGNVVGFTGQEKLAAVSAFVGKTGDFATGNSLAQGLGQISRVYGANFAEMGEAAGHAYNVLKDSIKDPAELQRAVLDTARGWAAQGGMGTVEIKDMARVAGRMGASTRAFAGDPASLLLKVGAFAQLAAGRGGASSAEEAATALSRVPSDIVTNRAKFKKADVDIFADKAKTKLADPVEIFVRALTKTRGDLTKVTPLFNEESRKVFQGVAPVFMDAEAANAKLAKGEQKAYGETGRAALLAEMRRFTGASLSPEQMQAQDASIIAEESTRIIEAQKAFREKIGTELLPVLTRVIPKFAEAVPALGRFAAAVGSVASFMLDNPYKGIGLVLAAAVAKDVATAGIGNLLQRIITSAAGGGSTGGVVPAGGGAKGALAATGAIVGVGAAVQQGSELLDQTGGWRGIASGLTSLFKGEGFAAGVDRELNLQAREKFQAENPFAPTPTGAPTDFKMQQEQLTNAARELSEAAKAIKVVAPEASRTAPMVAPSRG